MKVAFHNYDKATCHATGNMMDADIVEDKEVTPNELFVVPITGYQEQGRSSSSTARPT